MSCLSFSEKNKLKSVLIWNKIMVVSDGSEFLQETESTQNIELRKIISVSRVKNWRHKKIFLSVIIKAIFHQDKLRWLRLALTGSSLATAADQGSGYHKMNHTWKAYSSLMQWQEHSLWDQCLKAQMFREPRIEESTGGQGPWGTRPQLCLPQILINARGALLSLFITTGSSTGTVKCLHWTDVLVNQGKVPMPSQRYWHPLQLGLPE